MLGRTAGVEPKLRLQRADRTLALTEQLEDANASRVTEDAEEAGFRLVQGPGVVRHSPTISIF